MAATRPARRKRRKPPSPPPITATSRGTVANAVIGAVVTLGLAWIGLQQHQADASRDRIEVKLNRVEKNTDGAITAALLVASKQARRTAVLSGEPQDIQIADDAERAYNTQKELQQKAEHPSPP